MTTAEPKERTRIEPGWDMVDGVLVERDMGNESDFVGANFITLLNGTVKRGKLGRVFGSSAGYKYPALDDGRLKFPDVSYVSNARLAGGPPKSWADFPPDLVIEVVSPNDDAGEVQQKAKQWLAGGVRLLWVVYPESREVVVHHPDRSSQALTEGEELTGEDVLPGFRVAIADVFEGLDAPDEASA
jgi:Uma2 family endonuclease